MFDKEINQMEQINIHKGYEDEIPVSPTSEPGTGSILHPKHREYNYNKITNKKHEQSEYK